MLVVLVVVGVLSMWARYASEQAERRKREAMFRALSTYSSARPEMPAAAPPPAAPAEARDMFDSTLPQESFDLVRRAVGRDFKLMELSFGEKYVSVKVSADAGVVQQYQLDKDRKSVEGPSPVQLIGGGKLDDSLYDPAAANVALIPKLSQEALARAALPESKVTRVTLSYPIIRYAGEGPEWTVMVETGEGDKWQHKFVTFDTKGKFKSLL